MCKRDDRPGATRYPSRRVATAHGVTMRGTATRSAALLAALSVALVTGSGSEAAAAAPADTVDPRSAVAMQQIAATGTAEVRVPPSQASFSIGVITEASTAAQASAENARIYQAVDRALREARLEPREVVGSGLTVSPRWVYDEATRRQRRAGFEASHTIDIETRRLDRLGAYVDAALGAGASSVSSIDFSVENPAAARHQALEEAVENARGDAEAMARAAGGRLGELLLVSTEQPGFVPGVSFQEVTMTGSRRLPEAAGTSIAPSEIRVAANVTVRWAFVPATR